MFLTDMYTLFQFFLDQDWPWKSDSLRSVKFCKLPSEICMAFHTNKTWPNLIKKHLERIIEEVTNTTCSPSYLIKLKLRITKSKT